MIQSLSFLFLFALPAWAAEPALDFRFAIHQAGPGTTVALQGEAGSAAAIQRVCGAEGQLCGCEARDHVGVVVERIEAPHVRYERMGNYFTCSFSWRAREVSVVRVFRRQLGSALMTVQPFVSLGELLGPQLDLNRVRSIHRYSCEFNFLQKEGTTTQSFDCSRQVSRCDTGDFCLLQSRFPFFLYSDTYSTNFYTKPSDGLYNGGGTGQLCGLQIKQYNCADAEGAPVTQFGLYAEPNELWNVPVTLNAAPSQESSFFGYAVPVNPKTGRCPPGLERRARFQVAVRTSDITPSHNFPSGMLVGEVARPEAPPPPFTIQKFGQGSCNGSRCSMPVSYSGQAKPAQPFTELRSSEFCVIPAELLP